METLAKVRKQLVDGDNNISLVELMSLANVNYAEYMKAISTSSRGNVVVLYRPIPA